MTLAPDVATDLAEALRRAGVADVDDSGLARALYSSDGSLYRVLPRAVKGTPSSRQTARVASISSGCRGCTTARGSTRYSEPSEE